MRQRLIHVHVDIQTIQKHRSILIRHQVSNEAILREVLRIACIFRYFVGVNDLQGALFIIKRVQNLVESRIALLLIQEVDELLDVDLIGFSLSSAGRK